MFESETVALREAPAKLAAITSDVATAVAMLLEMDGFPCPIGLDVFAQTEGTSARWTSSGLRFHELLLLAPAPAVDVEEYLNVLFRLEQEAEELANWFALMNNYIRQLTPTTVHLEETLIDRESLQHTRAYFSKIRFGDIEFGGVAKSLRHILNDRAEVWLEQLALQIASHFRLECDVEDEVIARVVACLAHAISGRVAMACGLDESLVPRSELTSATFESILKKTEALVQERARPKLEKEIHLWRVVCALFDGNDLPSGEVAAALKKLVRLPEFKAHAGGANLAGLIDLILIGSPISEWRAATPPALLGELLRLSRKRLQTAETSKICTFLPTLRYLKSLPEATWSDSKVAVKAAFEHYLSEARMLGRQKAHDFVPSACVTALRLVSVVWEICADFGLFNALFAPGRVRPSLLAQPLKLHAQIAHAALQQLSFVMPEAKAAVNARRTTTELGKLRGTDFEQPMRSALRVVGRWSLQELLAVITPRSACFGQSASLTWDKTVQKMVQKPRRSTMRLLLDAYAVLVPILRESRQECRILPCSRTNPAVEALAAIPSLRDRVHGGAGFEIRDGELKAAGAMVRALLVALAKSGVVKRVKRQAELIWICDYQKLHGLT